MNILIVTSEAVPFAKTGGLADVCGALPVELARLGHQVAVIMPAYRHAKRCGMPIEPMGITFVVPIGSKTVSGQLLKSHLPDSDVPVYLVGQDEYYDLKELYQEAGKDYPNNCERFVFFSRSVLEAVRLLELKVDIIHANDWQTGLVPAYLEIEYRRLPRYEGIATLFTIHNIAYQGQFWHWDMLLTGLGWEYFNWRQMEFFGKVNLLKTGIVFADWITTVSPRYAMEIQNSPFGRGLEGVLRHRRNVLSGVMNGVHYDQWDPQTDLHLATNYTPDTVRQGKAECKSALQEDLGLPQRRDVPVLGFIGRLVRQKGIDLVTSVMQDWVIADDSQWVILGTGEPKYHRLLAQLAERFPDKVAVRLEFSNSLAHRIEAGADMFLMPSDFEPCGLNQLYSLKYGTVPVVRATGGLAETIVGVTGQPDQTPAPNGFSFREYSPLALSDTLRRAVSTYHDEPETWNNLIVTGMTQDWSWARSAREYEQLYQKILRRRREPPNARR